MALVHPTPSEVDLAGLADAARLAYILDALFAINTTLGGVSNPTVNALEAFTVAVGGTPITVASGAHKGGYIQNGNAAAQGVAAENIYVSMIGNPGSTDAAAVNGTFIVQPLGTFTYPAGATVKVNAATNGHRISGIKLI